MYPHTRFGPIAACTCARQHKPFPQIIHRQHQRIVGALLRTTAPRFPPRPAAFRRSCSVRFQAVPVIQQRREQRRRRRHPAAALRQRQRRMFMPQSAPPAARCVCTHTALHSLFPDPNPHRQRVDEQPHRPVRSSPPCIRPNSTVPNTTSSRPDTRASTCAHATWTQTRRTYSQLARPLPHPPRQFLHPARCAPPRSPCRLPAHPATRTAPSAPPHPPASSGKTPRAPPAHSPAAPAPPGCGMAAAAGSRSACPSRCACDLLLHHLQRRVITRQ